MAVFFSFMWALRQQLDDGVGLMLYWKKEKPRFHAKERQGLLKEVLNYRLTKQINPVMDGGWMYFNQHKLHGECRCILRMESPLIAQASLANEFLTLFRCWIRRNSFSGCSAWDEVRLIFFPFFCSCSPVKIKVTLNPIYLHMRKVLGSLTGQEMQMLQADNYDVISSLWHTVTLDVQSTLMVI